MKYFILFILAICAYQDYKKGIVHDWMYLFLIPFFKWPIIGVVLFTVFVLVYKYISEYIGGADIKIFICFMMIFPSYQVSRWLLYSFSIALIYAYTKQLKSIRMFPFFLIGYLVLLYEL